MTKCVKCPPEVKKIEDLCDNCLADYDEFLVEQQAQFEQGRLEMAEAQNDAAEQQNWRKAE